MHRSNLSKSAPLGIVLALAAGCATGEEATDEPTPSVPVDAAASADATEPPFDGDTQDADGKDSEPPPDVSPDVTADVTEDALQDAGEDAPEDAEPEVGPDADQDAAEAGCPPGYTGPTCETCDTGYLACDDACLQDCASCLGKALLCDGACVAECTGCAGSPVACEDACVPSCDDCSAAPFACDAVCVDDCASTCDPQVYLCDGACVSSCVQCAGSQSTCEDTGECLTDCSTCTGTCVDCPTGYHACAGGCHADVADEPEVGCMFTCDDQPCNVPQYGDAVCTNGACDITCNATAGFQESSDGLSCECDADAGFEANPQLQLCVCMAGLKGCGPICAAIDDPSHGCTAPLCGACAQPAHSTATCTGVAGACDFACDASAGYVKNASGTACTCPTGFVDSGTSCVCPAGEKACGGSCVSKLLAANGCAGVSCDACTTPAHASADCSGPSGTCGYACDSANGYVPNATGDGCECGPGLTDYGTHCACPPDTKLCDASCVSTSSVDFGCAVVSCTPCAVPDHGTATCAGAAGACDFTCDSANHWVKGGSACVCESGYKDCAGTCVDSALPSNGCATATCTACPLPDHAIAASCAVDGTCDFTCDAANHWVKSGAACVCDSGYTEQGGVCVRQCTGSTYGTSCYWYVATSATWDAAEAACSASGGHLASPADAAENEFIRGLAATDFWIGLRDYATLSASVDAEDCTLNTWLSGDGGRFTGTTGIYDDVDSCSLDTGGDDIFGLAVTKPSVYVFSTSATSIDTILGLYNWVNNTSNYTTCLGTSIECDDDDGPVLRSLIVRYLPVGNYAVVMDTFRTASGAYVLDVRRFDFVDGSAHIWANWNADEPDNAGNNEDCAQVIDASGRWTDQSCGNSRPYVCERPL